MQQKLLKLLLSELPVTQYPNRPKTVRLYDIEPNKYYEENLPHRSRYYQSLIDSKLLATNTSFRELPDVITIWFLPYDPFGDNRMLYTVKNMVAENNHLVYNDGVVKLFLFTKGTKGGSKELKDLLTFLECTTPANAVDAELLEIQNIVNSVKCDKEVGKRYMTLQEMIDYEKRASYNEGLQIGLVQGSINTCKSLNLDKFQTKNSIIKQYSLSNEQADEYMNLYW